MPLSSPPSRTATSLDIYIDASSENTSLLGYDENISMRGEPDEDAQTMIEVQKIDLPDTDYVDTKDYDDLQEMLSAAAARRSLTTQPRVLPVVAETYEADDDQHTLGKQRGRLYRRVRKGAKAIAGRAHSAGRKRVQQFQEKPPLCFTIVNSAYHKYGLKHIVLLLVFIFYVAFGAFVFLMIEGPVQQGLEHKWRRNIAFNRGRTVEHMMGQVFNNSEYLIYIKGEVSERLKARFEDIFASYESRLGIRWTEQRMEWDYWTAIIFAGTLCTTIGYGHIYPITPLGKILTMIYATIGIPLTLLVLQDCGKLLTLSMKYPWFQCKRLARRILRCCTKQSLREMRRVEEKERAELAIFDLPLPAGVGLVVAWIWLCSAVMTIWDRNWSFLEAFYFFFISLSTIGLGDLVPSNPRLLIIMFGFILVGLSLVSMVINLLQMRMRKTYETGRDAAGLPDEDELPTSLGMMKAYEPEHPSEREEDERSLSRSTQTSLSLPGARQVVLGSDGVHWVNHISPPKSPDEVTRLVEMESGLAVCKDIGENNADNDDNTDTHSIFSKEVGETDVMLESQTDDD